MFCDPKKSDALTKPSLIKGRPVRLDPAASLPLETALHAGRGVGPDADLGQARQEPQEARKNGEPGPEVQVAEGQGCNGNKEEGSRRMPRSR